MSSGLLAIRASSDANSAEQKRQADRKRNILVLINHYLVENGYVEAAERLQHETQHMVNKFTAADNVDLPLILMDYEAYYEMRFDRKPKVVRKLNEQEEMARTSVKAGKNDKKSKTAASDSSKLPNINPESENNSTNNMSMSITGTNIAVDANKSKKAEEPVSKFEDRVLKPPPQFQNDPELKQLASIISREIYQESPNVRFEDIVHLDNAKRLLMEAVQLPLRFPSLFTGILKPWRGILLHGPPGTGKTLLAKAVATECHTTFFNISASTLVSKWRGDSEKLVRVLFELARYHAPSTIFLDEIDSILTSRDGDGAEHEASRRMKTELLIQMDGMNNHHGKGPNEQQVFVMAASNIPWELDVALLRRLEKRVIVSLPTLEARIQMLKNHLSDRIAPNVDLFTIATATEGYSGADLELLCREAAMMPVRRLITKIDSIQQPPYPPPDQEQQSVKTKRQTAAASTSTTATTTAYQIFALRSNNQATHQEIQQLLQNDPVTMEDLQIALSTTKPSSDGKISK